MKRTAVPTAWAEDTGRPVLLSAPRRGAGASFVLQIASKRVMDIAVAALLLILLSPLLLLIGALVKLTSRGPVFYRWPVAGKDGRYFTGYKFRTMVDNADLLKRDLLADNQMRGPVFKMDKDPRVTGLGRLLRRVSLDELPQLWSVLKGDVSLVGPRPPLQEEYERFNAWQRQKLTVKPGITCLWQVSGRNKICDFDNWVRLDLEYIERWSLWLDVKILLLTAIAVISGRGAS
jgi:lipopolysaccharide/colanic/teichoic acid biosynthesis glycosyltransferase